MSEAKPVIVMDVDACVDEAMTAEEKMAETRSAVAVLEAAGYVVVLVRPGSRVERL